MADDAALPPCPHCGSSHPEAVLRCPVTDLVLPLPGRMLEGKFRLVRQIGRGGMASVWLARHVIFDREVAIKIIRPEVARSEEVQARFRGEAKAAGRIDHPNVCSILDYGVGALGPFIVMERLHGANLGQVLRTLGVLTPGQLVALLRPALQGLVEAHRQGIIHRDLKPENVFLHHPPGSTLVVKLMDFGVAKFADGSGEVETEQGALLGTPQYMAPEQFKGAALAEVRTDVWAIGAILYRALVGKDAFAGPTLAATLMRVTNEEPPPLREERPELPVELEHVVLRCLRKEPADRFADIEQLAAAIEALGIADEPLPELPLAELRMGGRAAPPPRPLPIPLDEPQVDDTLVPATARATARPVVFTPPQVSALEAAASIEGLGDASTLHAIAGAREATARAGSAGSAAWRRSRARAWRLSTLFAVLVVATLVSWPWIAKKIDGGRTRVAAASGVVERAAEGKEARPKAIARGGKTERIEAASDSRGAARPGAVRDPEATGVESNGAVDPNPAGGPDLEPDVVPEADAALDSNAVPEAHADPDVSPDTAPEPDTAQTPDPAPEDTTPEGVPTDTPDTTAEPAAPEDPPKPRPAPPTLVRWQQYAATTLRGPVTDHDDARKHCTLLAQSRHLGRGGWQLANPAVAERMAKTGAFEPGRYWTSARWQGRVKIVVAPTGRLSSKRANQKIARPLCVIREGD